MAGELEFADEFARLRVVVSLVEAKILRLFARWARPFNGDVLDRLAEQLEVVHIGAGDCEANRYAFRFREYAALRPPFGSVGWIGADFFPLRAVPSTSPRPSRATPNPAQRTRRSLPTRGSTPSRTRLPPSTPEIVGEPTSLSRSVSRSARSTDSPSVGRTGSRSLHPDPEHVDDGNQADGLVRDGAAAAPAQPTERPEFSSRRLS